ncbi:hypothetical protein [Salimicrobium halophilum]|uniref:Phr family secreted Rap phosphatase inhibitor n=1 Tax=Salimicrobium halophilum TaxID=86666 RepID=A0A1G8SD92_9BACI|nr:hypothetical protein [Salimicrobium halophilum]SDJ27154.1 hypothetical protein SAMN04490247_1392 [Salimicrobium halophilum]
MKKFLLVTVVALSVIGSIGPVGSAIAGEGDHPAPSVQNYAGEEDHPAPSVQI